MRVSLNLYRYPNFSGSRIIKKDSEEARNIKPDELVLAPGSKDGKAMGLRSVVVSPFRVYKPKKPVDSDKNLELVNSYIIGTEPHEDFDPYPVTFEELEQDRVTALGKVAMKCKSPRELVQYYSDYYYDICKKYGNDNSLMNDFLLELESKVRLDMLGLNIDEMSVSEKMKIAALYNFWGVRIEAPDRDGYERPDFIKSPAEFLDEYTQQSRHFSRFKFFLDQAMRHICPEQKEEAKRFDEMIDKEMKEQREEIKKSKANVSFITRNLFHPVRTPSILGRTEKAVQQRYDKLEPEFRPREVTYAPEYDPDLDMNRAWHEFIGGEWD